MFEQSRQTMCLCLIKQKDKGAHPIRLSASRINLPTKSVGLGTIIPQYNFIFSLFAILFSIEILLYIYTLISSYQTTPRG